MGRRATETTIITSTTVRRTHSTSTQYYRDGVLLDSFESGPQETVTPPPAAPPAPDRFDRLAAWLRAKRAPVVSLPPDGGPPLAQKPLPPCGYAKPKGLKP